MYYSITTWPQLPVFRKVDLTKFRKAKASWRKDKTKARSEGYQGTGEKKRVNSGKRDRGQRCISEAKEYVQEDWGGSSSAAGEVTKGITATRKQNLIRFSTSEDFAVQKSIYVQGKIQNDLWFNRFSHPFSSTHSLSPSVVCQSTSGYVDSWASAMLLFISEVAATFFDFQTL